jgi:hypothetical protein
MGFLDKIINLFFFFFDLEAAKKRMLQQIVKDLNQNKYSKFYRAKTGELEGAFAKCFYDIYKVISPAQVFLQNAVKSEQLKQITLDTFLDKETRAIKDRLSASSIQEKAATAQVKDLSAAVKRELANYSAAFDNTRINNIDNSYNAIISLVHFVCFDFFYILKKFDPAINERNFNYQPKFAGVKSTDLAEQIKDFMEYSAAVEMDWDWKTVLGILKIYKEGMDVVNPDHWTKVVRLLKDLSRTRIFELIIQHA